MINREAKAEEIREYAQAHDTMLLQDNMRQLVLEGITTPEEYVKITYSID